MFEFFLVSTFFSRSAPRPVLLSRSLSLSSRKLRLCVGQVKPLSRAVQGECTMSLVEQIQGSLRARCHVVRVCEPCTFELFICFLAAWSMMTLVRFRSALKGCECRQAYQQKPGCLPLSAPHISHQLNSCYFLPVSFPFPCRRIRCGHVWPRWRPTPKS